MIRFENRKKIQYSLLGVMVATLILLLSAVAIRFFQESKLSAVGNQLTECSNIKSIIKESREELSNAQIYLYSYLTTNEEPFLDRFYQSLKDVTLKIDSTRLIESTLSIDGIGDTLIEERGLKLERLELLIDSIALLSPKLKLIQQERGEPIRLERPSSRVERVEEYIYDTIPRRNFFQRLSDAFKGDVIVKRDTVFITTKYHTDIDLDKAQSELDSTLDALYIQHINRLQQYEEYLSSIRSRSVTLFKIYNNLFTLSTGLIVFTTPHFLN